jgi:5,5'-dehydrodivanillate O-demethylase oxygenase subunit
MPDATDYVHAGPGTLMGTLLRKFWQPVALAADVAPSAAIPIRVLNEDLTLYRGDSGASHLIAFRCAHRGTQLSTGWVEGDCIRCFYHGWKYDHTGQCVEMPAEDPSFPPKVKIRSYPAREYAGLIFAYLGDGESPAFPYRAELDRDYGVRWADKRIWPCNWFQRIENSVDAAHVSFVHRDSSFGDAVTTAVPELEYEETGWGIRQIATRSPENVRISEIHWPNCNHIVTPPYCITGPYPWTDLFNWFVPVDDETSAMFSARCAPLRGEVAQQFADAIAGHLRYDAPADEEALFSGRLAPQDTPDPVAAQDYIAQLGQGRVADRVHERLGRSDRGVIFLRQLFRREMEAIGQNRPGKQWQVRQGFAYLPVPPRVPQAPDV